MNGIIDLRNRVYPAGEDEILAHLFDAERMGHAETRDALPRIGSGLYWGEPGGPLGSTAMIREGERLRRESRYAGEPASGRQTAAIVGTLVCGCLLLAGLAYLAWSGAHGSYIWAR